MRKFWAIALMSACVFPAHAADIGIKASSLQDVEALAPNSMENTTKNAAQRFNLSSALIRAVIAIESGSNARAVSAKGAMGLMQLMPQTYAELRTQYHLGADPFDIQDNIVAGSAYLREMLDRFGSSGFLAAYHAGPTRYLEHLMRGSPLPRETEIYLDAIAQNLQVEHIGIAPNVSSAGSDWTGAPLFASLKDGGALAEELPVEKLPRDTKSALAALIPPPSNGMFIDHSQVEIAQ